jgi:shikimate kinase
VAAQVAVVAASSRRYAPPATVAATAQYNSGVAIRRHPQRNIVLSGFYGCRLDEVGRDLARRMRRPLFQVPAEIARRRRHNLHELTGLGRPVSDEQLEEWVIRDLSFRRGTVAVLDVNSLNVAEQFSELKVFSYLVFLDPPFPALWERIERDPNLSDLVLELGRAGLYERWLRHREQYDFCNLQLFVPPDDVVFMSKLVTHCFFT